MINSDIFENFMSTHQDMVFSTALRLVGNEADAADISQEVFLRAYHRFDELSRSHRAGVWLRTVAKNLSLNHLSRYRYRWRFFSEMVSQDSDDDYAETVAAPSALEALPEADRRELLETALKQLPATQRVPLVLYHFEEMNYEEIARQLGISLSKVKTDIHRGRQALYEKLRRMAGGELLPERSTPQGSPAPQPRP
jgi:RNA polymerase sigma-70 factor, ECF subfamily